MLVVKAKNGIKKTRKKLNKMKTEIQAPVETNDGIFGNRREHPAFGCVQISRPHGGHNVLFGSEIIHNSYVSLAIYEAVERYDTGYKSHSPRNPIIEIKMSADQWARMVSSIGIGEGTPCTLDWIRGTGRLPRIPEPVVGEQHKQTISEKGQQAINASRKMIAEIEALQADGKISAKAAKVLLGQARMTINIINGTMPFVVEQAQEHIEKIVTDAKSTVEAHLRQIVWDAGIEHLTGDNTRLEVKMVDGSVKEIES